VADLHIWRVGPSHLAAIVSVVSRTPRPPEHYKDLLRAHADLVHLTVEVHGRSDELGGACEQPD
jgi:Co/Zn/Cd efflux system component